MVSSWRRPLSTSGSSHSAGSATSSRHSSRNGRSRKKVRRMEERGAMEGGYVSTAPAMAGPRVPRARPFGGAQSGFQWRGTDGASEALPGGNAGAGLRRRGGHDGGIPAARQFRAGNRHGRWWRLRTRAWAVDRRHLDGPVPGREPGRVRWLRHARPAAALYPLVEGGLPESDRRVLRHRHDHRRGAVLPRTQWRPHRRQQRSDDGRERLDHAPGTGGAVVCPGPAGSHGARGPQLEDHPRRRRGGGLLPPAGTGDLQRPGRTGPGRAAGRRGGGRIRAARGGNRQWNLPQAWPRPGARHWLLHRAPEGRSEERRVGKECRSRWAAYLLEARDVTYCDRESTVNLYCDQTE